MILHFQLDRLKRMTTGYQLQALPMRFFAILSHFFLFFNSSDGLQCLVITQNLMSITVKSSVLSLAMIVSPLFYVFQHFYNLVSVYIHIKPNPTAFHQPPSITFPKSPKSLPQPPCSVSRDRRVEIMPVIIIKCLFAHLFLLFDSTMPPKNLINQNQLVKISKTTPFQIRNKPKCVKICLLDKQSNNPDTPFDTHKELDLCLDLIRNQLKNDPLHKIYQRVAKLLQEVKIGWQPMDYHTTELETEQHQINFRPLRKSSSKHTHRNRIQAYEEFKVGELPPCPPRAGSEVKKNKAIRLKIGKQNHENLFFTPKETRLEIVTHKLEEAEILINLQKTQLQESKSQIQNLLAANQLLKKESLHQQQSNAQLQSQLQSVVEEKVCCESALEGKIIVIDQLQRESCTLNELFRMRLQEREQQIAAFWQLQAF